MKPNYVATKSAWSCVGKWDVSNTEYIQKPEKLEEYLQTRIVTARQSRVQGGGNFHGYVRM